MGRVPAVTTSHRRHAHADTKALVNFIAASNDGILVISWFATSYLCVELEVSVGGRSHAVQGCARINRNVHQDPGCKVIVLQM